MKRVHAGVLAGATLALTLVLACRGIIGIDALEGPGADAGTDTTSASDATDAPVDTGMMPPMDGGPPDPATLCIDASADSGGCPGCCHSNFSSQLAAAYLDAVDSGCICGSAGACTSGCSGGGELCSGGMMAPMGCGPCVDMLFNMPTPGACMTTVNRCTTDKMNCAPALICLKSCTQQ